MSRTVILLSSLLLSATAFAAAQVDERALKSSALNAPRSVAATPQNTVNYTGTNVGGVSWDRPFADGTCCSALGPVLLSTQAFSVSANDTCDITSVQTGFDGYLFVYRAPFNPATQTVNFVAGDDDGAGGIGTSEIIGVPLTAGNYIAVTTGFEAGDEGSFANSIVCPTATVALGGGPAPLPPAIPAPAMNSTAIAVLALVLLTIGVVAVRSRQG